MQPNAAQSSAAVAHARVDAEVRDALEQLAKANHRSVAGEIRRALEEHLERERVPTGPKDAA
jgi:predicted transcriptional regulator